MSHRNKEQDSQVSTTRAFVLLLMNLRENLAQVCFSSKENQMGKEGNATMTNSMEAVGDQEDDDSNAPVVAVESSNDDDDEERDEFPEPSIIPVLDPESLRRIARGQVSGGPPSVATTDIASDVGSILGAPKEAFLKSFTFYKSSEEDDLPLGILLSDSVTSGRFRKKSCLYIQSVTGKFAHSRIVEGDYLNSINGKRLGASYNSERAMKLMENSLKNDGYLIITTKNNANHTDDILVHATIIKPRPDMTFQKTGMVVWIWGYLCIKSISKQSIFKKTALKETDNIVSVNEILCDRIGPEEFAEIITRLDNEITITVLRRKERLTGKFG